MGLIKSCPFRSVARSLLQWRTCHAVGWGVVWCRMGLVHPFCRFTPLRSLRSHTHAVLVHPFCCFTPLFVGLDRLGLVMSFAVCFHMDFASEYVCLQFHRCVKAAYLYIVSFVLVGVRFEMVCLRAVGELIMVLAFNLLRFMTLASDSHV